MVSAPGGFMNRCFKCNNDFEGSVCPFCGTQYTARKPITPVFSKPKIQLRYLAGLLFCFLCISYIPDMHIKNIIGAAVFGLLGLSMIFIPRPFVYFFIRMGQKNYEQSLDENGKPIGGKAPQLFKALGINKRNMSKPPNKTQEWLIRILGFSFIVASVVLFYQEF
jgi:hypothetical protein